MKAATLIGAGSRVASNATIASAVPVQAPHARQCATMLVPACRVQPSPAFTLQSTCQARSRPYSLRQISVQTFAAEADYETEDEVELDFKSGDVVVGVVDGIRPFGAFIKLGDSGANGLLHISQISSEYIDNVDSVLQVGEQVKVLVTRIDRDTNRISLTTRRLERSPGDMINNRQAVWDGAEEMAEQVRSEWAECRAERQARGDGDGGFRNRSRRDDGDGGFRGRGGGRGGRGGRGGGRGGYGGERRQRRDFD